MLRRCKKITHLVGAEIDCDFKMIPLTGKAKELEQKLKEKYRAMPDACSPLLKI
jgi:hypothetical protein